MHTYHAVAWLDHREAKLFFFDRDGFEAVRLTTGLPHHQIHNKAGSIEGRRNPPDQTYYREIVAALEPAMEWLILGPGTAHEELADHIRSQHPHLAGRIIGVQAADHPTDGEVVAHARAFFRAADRMLP